MPRIVYTGEELLNTVRERGMIPNSNALGTTDQDLLRLLNEEMISELIPAVMKVKEDYFIISRRIAISATTPRVRIPSRAIGISLKEIAYVDANGNRFDLGSPRSRTELSRFNSPSSQAIPSGYYIEGNYIVLLPNLSPAFSGFLELSFAALPGQVVLSSETVTITMLNLPLKNITTTTQPSSFTSFDTYEIHSPESGAELKVYDLTVAAQTSTAITFDQVIDGSTYGTYVPQLGDYVCKKGTAALPGLPVELHPVLAQAGLVRILRAMGDIEAAQEETQVLNRQLVNAGYVVGQRIQDRPKKIVNRRSLLGSWGYR